MQYSIVQRSFSEYFSSRDFHELFSSIGELFSEVGESDRKSRHNGKMYILFITSIASSNNCLTTIMPYK